jgi:acyl-CoA synthetase (AMP-forming)/AMP-acid ligase II
VVALLMGNCPEFVAAWIGLSKLGVITAWINYNLRNEPLRHSIDIAKTKAVISAADLQSGASSTALFPHCS